ncbi:MAG: response regulator [Deltaproteobacteria bacterium]|nr:response regulator [Deltaproteobacteria bacterium]
MEVLIAEDNPTSRKLLETLLNKWGYEVISASDGNEAWKALQGQEAPKLAILDWMMPGMDGVEICRRVRQKEESISMYIILLTAKDHKEDIVLGLEAGADDYVIKPFEQGELHARLNTGKRIVELQAALSDRIKRLQDANSHIKTLQGILPICSYCHKIRDDQESWQRIESYIQGHSDAQFSHSICPECMEKYFPDPEVVKKKEGED